MGEAHAWACSCSLLLGRRRKTVESFVVVVCYLCPWPLGPKNVLYLRSFPAMDNGLLCLREVLERKPDAPSRLLSVFPARSDALGCPRRVFFKVHGLESLGIARATTPGSLWLRTLFEGGFWREILRAFGSLHRWVINGEHHLVSPRVIHVGTGLFVLGVCLHHTVDLSRSRLEVRVHLLAWGLGGDAERCFDLNLRQPGASRRKAIPVEELNCGAFGLGTIAVGPQGGEVIATV
mmetsp:Transcript_30790/g.60258  ORF Transcript_30790/g.60258 Transcript_30790/m.60258 type:complete len:235 (+) Transcript_30790:122-826(+)